MGDLGVKKIPQLREHAVGEVEGVLKQVTTQKHNNSLCR